MMSSYLDCGLLEFKELIAEITRYSKLRQTRACFLRKVISHLDVDVIRRDQVFARPALVNDLNQLVRDVDAPAVVPSIFKPTGQLVARIVIEHINVKFALMGEARESEI